MRGFLVLILMVMAMLMIAPMTVMAYGGMGGAPVLAIALDIPVF